MCKNEKEENPKIKSEIRRGQSRDRKGRQEIQRLSQKVGGDRAETGRVDKKSKD
jgi:hypothetical protein